jgi:hypothetical protein
MVKPASGTALNTSGTLYTGLNNWYGMLEGSGGTTADGKSSNTGTLDGTVTWTSDGDGPLLTCAGGVQVPIAISSVVLSAAGATDWSVAWRGQLANDDSHGGVLGKAGLNPQGAIMSGGIALEWSNAAGAVASFTCCPRMLAPVNYISMSTGWKMRQAP